MKRVVLGKLGRGSVVDKAAFVHYKKTATKRKKENTYQLYQYRRLINALYRRIGEKLVESTGGVFIPKLGYFTIIEQPKRQVITLFYNGGTDYYNFHSDNRTYSPMFFGIAMRRTILPFWSMDRTFSRSVVKRRLHELLLAGKKYKTFVSTLSTLYMLRLKTNK